MIGERLKSDIYIYSGATFVKVKLMKRRNVERTPGGRESAKKAEEQEKDFNGHSFTSNIYTGYSQTISCINISLI
jgi:hypothetical protein